jgi:hypothetical protein
MVESNVSRTGLVNLGVKHAGEHSAGNPPVAFDVAGTGNVKWIHAPVLESTWEGPESMVKGLANRGEHIVAASSEALSSKGSPKMLRLHWRNRSTRPQ